MCTLVTKEAPDFTAKAVMPDNSFAELKLSSYRGKYVVLFFYPLDFTFVCPSEIIAFDAALAKFEKKNAQVIGVSVDSHYTHLAWKNTPRKEGGIGPIKYPLVSDLDKSISRSFGVLLEAGVALRGLFLIDKQGVVRHALINDLPHRPQRGRGLAGARRPAIPRGARRRLPGQLACGRGGDEADRRGRGRVPGETRRSVSRPRQVSQSGRCLSST